MMLAKILKNEKFRNMQLLEVNTHFYVAQASSLLQVAHVLFNLDGNIPGRVQNDKFPTLCILIDQLIAAILTLLVSRCVFILQFTVRSSEANCFRCLVKDD